MKNLLEVMERSLYGGVNKRFPDGSAGGDCSAYNDVISLRVFHYTSKDHCDLYSTIMCFIDSPYIFAHRSFYSGKRAIELAEKLLREVNNGLLSIDKLAYKYKLHVHSVFRANNKLTAK